MTYKEKNAFDTLFLKRIGKCPSCKETLCVTPDRKVFEEVSIKYGEVKCKFGCPKCGIFIEVRSWDTKEDKYHEICKLLKNKWDKFIQDVRGKQKEQKPKP